MMKNTCKRSISLFLFLVLIIVSTFSPLAVAESRLQVTYEDGKIQVEGKVAETLAIAVLVYNSTGKLIIMQTVGVDEGNFEAEIEIDLDVGEYTVKVAKYEGGDFLISASFEVEDDESGSGEPSTPEPDEPSTPEEPIEPDTPLPEEPELPDEEEEEPYYADVSGDKKVQISIDKNKSTALVDLLELLEEMPEEKEAVLTIPPIDGVDTFTSKLPVVALSKEDQGSLLVNTTTGTLKIPTNMLAETGLVGEAEITIAKGNKDELNEDVKAAVGDRPLIKLSLAIDGQKTAWKNEKAPVTVSIPYTPSLAELESPESIVIWYIDSNGEVVTITNGRYDALKGVVTFSTTHFSDYAVVFNKIEFDDVPVEAWYKKAVDYVAAREITKGTGEGKYSPAKKLTRGEFLVLIMRAYSIQPDAALIDNFFDAGNTWYTDYLKTAKSMGIAAGIGNNLYAPNNEITRQEMFALLYNTLNTLGKLPQEESDRRIDDFVDKGNISSWALEATEFLVKTGIVQGSDNKIMPESLSNRAEIAQLLFSILNQ